MHFYLPLTLHFTLLSKSLNPKIPEFYYHNWKRVMFCISKCPLFPNWPVFPSLIMSPPPHSFQAAPAYNKISNPS